MPADRPDLHQQITDQIIAMLEDATEEFELPWHNPGGASMRPINVTSQRPYRGINILALWAAAHRQNYSSGIWGTYRQWAAQGAQVRKGEKGPLVVFYQEAGQDRASGDRPCPLTGKDPGKERSRLIIRASAVFAAEQVQGYELEPAAPRNQVEILAQAEAFVAATGASITLEGHRAFYRPSTDSIHLPSPNLFAGTKTSTPTEAYYSTLLHELSHWSGHASRCDRQLTGRFGSEAYAMEELIAELGSAFLSAELGITPSPRQDHAQYLANWLSVLRDDKRAIFTAASKASQAAAFLSSLQPAAQETPSPQPVGLGEAASRAVHQAAASRKTRQSPPREPMPAYRDC